MSELAVQPHIFHTLLPVRFRLPGQRHPLYIFIPRISYLPLIVPLLITHIGEPESAVNERDVYFSCNSVPLKWHYPAGLLYDLFYPRSNQLIPSANNSPSQDDLAQQELSLDTNVTDNSSSKLHLSQHELTSPYSLETIWSIDVHFGETFPVDKLLTYTGPESLSSTFMNAVKEADYMRQGSAKKVMSLTKAQQQQLWQGVVNHDYSLVDEIQSLLLDTITRLLPIRIYDTIGVDRSAPLTVHVYQRPIAVADGKTLSDLRNIVLEQHKYRLEQKEQQANSEPETSIISFVFLIHGMVITDFDTPLAWLYLQSAYPDGWMHVIAVSTSE